MIDDRSYLSISSVSFFLPFFKKYYKCRRYNEMALIQHVQVYIYLCPLYLKGFPKRRLYLYIFSLYATFVVQIKSRTGLYIISNIYEIF